MLTLGGVLASESVHAPANVTVHGHIPHDALLPHVSTVLAAGIPMVCVPQGREQPLNAQLVADVAAGLQVAPDAPAGDLVAALHSALTDPRYRTIAGQFAAATTALGNGRYAADLVEAVSLETTRRPG
jgi:UDP:flavonoid glycosyltransferase YjiC (YdhE family)